MGKLIIGPWRGSGTRRVSLRFDGEEVSFWEAGSRFATAVNVQIRDVAGLYVKTYVPAARRNDVIQALGLLSWPALFVMNQSLATVARQAGYRNTGKAPGGAEIWKRA